VKSAWLVEVKGFSIYGVAKDVLLVEILSLHAQSTEIWLWLAGSYALIKMIFLKVLGAWV
jgi:hypothetical protein